eukprot:CAMPEP_0194355864 /NCGR_PEP_ID=MMETSP0174-20130528/3718_1 /TAXON_ID=216777 /ORGANISM="Proboscia alata, Strain PI-D3" /LENGTH=282 /DNA_ID=CAMNT_0039125309 /DNA_START=21 /DNA_END=869 /DNA_ORIENTATION=+
MRQILVTGGNQGIGYALCKQLAIEHNCHVYLTARSADKGLSAVSRINEAIGKNPSCTGSIDFIPLDTTSDASVAAAAEEAKTKLSSNKLFGIVNNAGIGLNTGQTGDMLNTNLYGPKRVCESFIPLMDETQKNGGRIINIGSGSGPMHVSSSSQQDKQKLCSPDTITWDYIEEHAKAGLNNYNTDVYGLSKALVACYTGVLAREHPNLLISCCTPGFIDTQMTEGWGASKSPEQGTAPILHCLFDELEDGSGLYYGSDGVRSPYHFMRNPGQPAYDGVNPFI